VNYGSGNANLQSKIFFIWFGCCFLCLLFVYFMIYETKGLSLEQVDELYSKVGNARKSVGWKPTVTFTQIVNQKRSSVSQSHHDEHVAEEKA
jgi:hypothetical protein